MNQKRDDQALVAHNGFLYALGGGTSSNNGFLSHVEYAPINPDGELGPWVVANPMIMTRPQVGAVVDKDGFLYAVGGGWHSTQRNSVERANLSADDGSVGTWEVVGMLTTNRALAGATIAGGRLYVVGGHTGSFGTGTTKTTERVLLLTPTL